MIKLVVNVHTLHIHNLIILYIIDHLRIIHEYLLVFQ